MTSANSTSWEKELRKNICTNFGRGIRVNGENSGRTKKQNFNNTYIPFDQYKDLHCRK